MSYNSPNVLPLERSLRTVVRGDARQAGLSIAEQKDEAARGLIRRHFDTDPAIVRVYRILNDKEEDPKEPIKLLEISSDAVPTEVLDMFGFAPDPDMPFYLVFGILTPEDFREIRDRGALPAEWDLDKAQVFVPDGR